MHSEDLHSEGMRKKGAALLFLGGLLLGGFPLALGAPLAFSAAAGTATFDHRVRVFNVHGTVMGVSSSVQLDVNDLAATSGTVTVPLENLKTGIGLRDNHARSEVALNTAKFPNAVFTLEKLTGGRLLEGQTLATTASGQLTVKGVTKTASIPVKATLVGGQVKVSTQFAFNPHDFGVNYPGSSDRAVVNVTFTLSHTP